MNSILTMNYNFGEKFKNNFFPTASFLTSIKVFMHVLFEFLILDG